MIRARDDDDVRLRILAGDNEMRLNLKRHSGKSLTGIGLV